MTQSIYYDYFQISFDITRIQHDNNNKRLRVWFSVVFNALCYTIVPTKLAQDKTKRGQDMLDRSLTA